jgi:hypothetical protein
LPNVRVVHHFVPAMPVRVSALRSLGAYSERVLDRELHGRIGESRERGSRRISFALPRRPARARRHQRGGQSFRDGRNYTRSRDAAGDLRSPATRTSVPTSRSQSKSTSTAKPDVSECCARSPRSIAVRWSIPTGFAIRSRAASSSHRAGRCLRR